MRCRCTAVGAASPHGCSLIASQCSLRSADTPQIQDIRVPCPPRSAIQLCIKLPCLGDGIGGVLLQVGFDFLNHLIVIHVRHEVIGNISSLLPSLRLLRRNIVNPQLSLAWRPPAQRTHTRPQKVAPYTLSCLVSPSHLVNRHDD